MIDQECDVRRFVVGEWEIRLLTHRGLLDGYDADIAKAAAEGLAFHVEESFEDGGYPSEGYAESCGRLAQMIFDGLRNIASVEVAVDGEGVVLTRCEDAE